MTMTRQTGQRWARIVFLGCTFLSFLLGLYSTIPASGVIVSAWVVVEQIRSPRPLPQPQQKKSTFELKHQLRPRKSSSLFYMSSEGEEKAGIEDDDGKDDPSSSAPSLPSPICERLSVAGVSVSPKGFHVILARSISSGSGTDNGGNDGNDLNTSAADGRWYLPLKVTNDLQDTYAATSAESLTLCQLLSGVDMAGAILPPDLLSRLVVYHIEEKWQDLQEEAASKVAAGGGPNDSNDKNSSFLLTPQELKVLDAVQDALPEQCDTYKDAHEWFQSRTRLPQVTLDQLTMTHLKGEDGVSDGWHFRLECNLPDLKGLKLVVDDLSTEILAPLMYNYDPETSLLFTCLALALRYKAPVVLERDAKVEADERTIDADNATAGIVSLWSSPDDLDQSFPQRTTVSNLQEQSTRVTQNIERGFEIHKLTGALQIAMRMGDAQTAERIRAKLDEYDSLQDLPITITSAAGDNIDVKDDSLDDLDKNQFQ